MQKEQLHINNKAFSLVEIILAIAIFLVYVSAIFGITYGSWQQEKNAINKERATYLAEEAIEASRNMRDASFANLVDGTHGLALSGNQWVYSSVSDATDIFTRKLTVSTINTNQKKIEAVVSWTDPTYGNNSVTLNTYLTNFRKIIPNPGITVNKTVINHGATKTTSDFEPYQVGSTTVTLGTPKTVDPGTYTVSETANSSYITTFSGDCDLSGNITLTLGDAKICSITNEEKASQLTVTKVVSGGTKTVSDFPLFVDATPVTSGSTNTFNSGSHTVSETSVPSYSGVFSGDCNPSGIVNLVAGTTKTCTLTNTFTASMPTVTTTSPITSITRTTATGGGNVTSDGGDSVTARGVVWSTSINPTTALSTKTSNGTGTGSFTSSITSLTCNTLYHVRAYATNSVGTSYGSDVTFTTSACSTITYVGQSTANGTTASIPAHNVGDLLLVFAYKSGNNTPPTIPSGWITINASGAANNSSSLAYRIATGSDSGSGFTGANEIVTLVYRGVSVASPIGANAFQHANSTTVTYPALSLNVTNGSSWVVGSAGAADKNTTIETAPTGMTARSNIVGGSAEASGFDTNGGVSSWTAQNVVIDTKNNKWSARTLELKSQ